MSGKSRILFAVTLTAALIALMLVLLIGRMRVAQREGMAGLAYIQVLKDGKAPPNLFPVKPGHVLMIYPGGPAEEAGIRYADEIRAINGIALTDQKALHALDARLGAGDVLTYTVRRGGTELQRRVPLAPPWPHPLLVTYVVVYSIVAVAFIAIGLLVFTRAPLDRRATVFYAMVTIGALSLLGYLLAAADVRAMRGIVSDPEPNLVTMGILALFALAFFPLALHLALVFPKDRPALVRNPRLLRWVYGVPFASLLLGAMLGALTLMAVRSTPGQVSVIDDIIKWGSAIFAVAGLIVALRIARVARIEGVRHAFWSRPLQTMLAVVALLIAVTRIVAALNLKWIAVGLTLVTMAGLPLVVVIAYPIIACVLLYRSYREADLEERRQVKWPLWGMLIAVGSKIVFGTGGLVLVFVLMGIGSDLSRWAPVTTALQLLPIILYLLIPISFAVAILKYRLMNIDVIIKKTVVYTILSGAIIVFYIILVGGLGTVLVRMAGVQNQTMIIASTLVVAVLFVPLRNRLQHLVDRNLFRHRIDYPQALRSIAADAIGASELNGFLKGCAEKLQQALQNRAVVIFQRRSDVMVATAKVGVADSILGSAAIAASTAETFERPVEVAGGELPERDAATLRKLDATFVVPVRSHGAAVALIVLARKLSDQAFGPDDIEFASSAADQIAIGIDRIRLQHDEADFEQARALQQTLLPAEAPRLPGVEVAGIWQPARTVGGDYYDLLKLSDSELGLCIGDVAGKGMPAALLMSGLQAAVRASADAGVAPSRVCERVRRVVVPSLGSRFVTFFYCTFDTASRHLRFCNAGHNPPVLVRADGSTERLSAGGPVLSRLFRNASLQDSQVELGIGDRVVLFTDGVSEARDAAEQEFGEQRLEEFVAANRALDARELASAIAREVSAYAEGRTDDDLTLVTMAVTEPA